MRIDPSAGRSTFVLVSVSKSRIDPAQRLVARQRRDHSPQLRAALPARERDAERAQVSADRLELADDCARVRGAVAAFHELAEALERLARVDLCGCRRRENRPCVLAYLVQV